MCVAEPSEASVIMDLMDAEQRVILYSIGALGQPLKNNVDIQKIIFLSSKALPSIFDDLFYFEAHKKGPYSEDIDEEVKTIKNMGLISEISKSNIGLSDLGNAVYQKIEHGVREPLKSTICDYKEFILDLTEDELLTFIYVAFPEFKKNSEEWQRLEKKRTSTAVSLLKKEKVSASRAAEIADMRYFEFEDYLRDIKMRWKS